jgi:hypothetical protein
MRLSRPITTWATASIHLEPRHFRVAQVDHDAGAIGGLDSRLAERIAQADRPGCACALRVVRFGV